MTDQDKAHIVAEWCGWRVKYADSGCVPNWRVINPTGRIVARHQTEDTCTNSIPDYNSLDACAEFEWVVKERGLEGEYERALVAVCGQTIGTLGHKARTFDIATATPAQRVDAILQVIGGTRDEKQA